MRGHVTTDDTRGRRIHGGALGLKIAATAALTALVGALAVVPAQAATTDLAEAEASLLSGSGIVALDDVAALRGAYSATGASGSLGVVRPGLDLSVVNALDVGLGSVRLLGGDGILTLGVAGQYASSTPTGATASAGAIGADGAIAVGSGAPGTGATLDLRPLLSSVPAKAGVLSDVELGLGALSSSITETRTAGGATTSTAYQVAGARYTMTSPAVSALTSSLQATVAGTSDGINGLTGQAGALDRAVTGVRGPLETTLRAVNGLGLVVVETPTVSTTVSVDLRSTVTAQLAKPLTSGPVTITPSTGQVVVDLGALDGLDPNTDLLNPAQVTAITDGITDILTNQLPTGLTTAIDAAVRATAVTVDLKVGVAVPVALGAAVRESLTVQVKTTLGQLLDGTTQASAVTVGGTGLLTTLTGGLLTGAVRGVVTSTLLPLVGDVYRPLLTGSGLAATTTAVKAVTGATVTTLAPLTTLLRQLVTVTINAQDGVGFRDGRGTDAGSTSVHAVSLRVLPAILAARVDLATSTVRAVPFVGLTVATPTEGQQFVVPAAGATRTVTLTGTGEPGATVRVEVPGVAPATGVVGAAGAWSVAVAAVPAGTHAAAVTQLVGGQVTATATRGFTIVTQQPLTITDPVADRVFTVLDGTSTTPVTVSGRATPGATVAVSLGGGRTGSALVGTDGGWTTTIADVPVGSYTASATQSLGGDTSAAVTRGFRVAAGAALALTSPAPGTTYRVPDASSGQDVVVAGTGQPGAVVTVALGGRTQEATVTGGGAWSTTFTTVGPGSYPISARQTVGGATSAPRTTDVTVTAADAVVITSPDPAVPFVLADPSSTTPVTVTGTADRDAPVRVDLGGGLVATTTASGTGAWSVTFAAVPVGADRTVSVTQTVAGVTSTPVTQPLVVRAAAPLAILAPDAGASYRVPTAGSTTTVPVSGTAAVGASVTVSLGTGVAPRTVTATDGTWSVSFTGVPVGGRTISATQTVGGTTSPAQTRPIAVVAGQPLVITTPAVDATVTVAGADDVVDVVVTGTADPGARVDVGLGGSLLASTTADAATGEWTATITGVAVDRYTLGATQTVGGVTSPIVSQGLVVAAGAPVVITRPGDDLQVYYVAGTGGTTPVVVTGTGQPGAVVTVAVGDDRAADVVVPVSGTWTVSVPGVPVGSYVVSASQSINGT